MHYCFLRAVPNVLEEKKSNTTIKLNKHSLMLASTGSLTFSAIDFIYFLQNQSCTHTLKL